MAYDKVIVFGATGDVGSKAALTARQLGAEVVLALRDPSKAVPGLSAAQEQAGGFERVQADLTQPETLRAAVEQTGARAVFIYVALASPDHQRSSLEALKAAGVDWVVLLSSLSVQGDPRAIGADAAFIPFAHASVEVALQDVFGLDHYAAVRPGWFATNLYNYKPAIAASDAPLIISPLGLWDFIAAEDMGRVAGHLLVQGRAALTEGKNEIFIAGPQLTTLGEAITAIGKVLGRNIKAQNIEDDEDAFKLVSDAHPHMPEPLSRQLVAEYRKAEKRSPLYDMLDEAIANVPKYGGGQPGMTVQQWAEAHAVNFK
ncbi:hypothetical protein B0J18DRAFT_433240 [Chaetomium sp. MPI-SDFR-AT-0129]|nr:hypothetical protein B0J18DRAFT_433240 [Chaetomium sp. MPI-SDFR-AT-0129]